MKTGAQTMYEMLDVAPEAGMDAIRHAWRHAAEAIGNGGGLAGGLYAPEEGEALAARIDEAFQILTDRERRRRYDRYLEFRRTQAVTPRDPSAFHHQARLAQGASPAPWAMESPPSPWPSAGGVSPVEGDSPRLGGPLPVTLPSDPGSWADGGSTPFPPPSWPPVSPGEDTRQPFIAADSVSVPGSEGSGRDAATDAGRATLRNFTRESVARMRARVVPADPLPLRPIPPAVLAAAEQELGLGGAFLRRVRELRGIDLPSISDRTKISILYLRFIEDENLADLPAAIYLRGFIQQLARILDIPEQKVVDGYMALHRRRNGG